MKANLSERDEVRDRVMLKECTLIGCVDFFAINEFALSAYQIAVPVLETLS